MIYKGTYDVEIIEIVPMDDMSETHYIQMQKSRDDATFSVTCCCDEDFYYEFMYNKSDYERVKFNIMECIFECDTMEELLDTLSEVFEDGFEPIEHDPEYEEFECDGDCENCEFIGG